MVNAMVDIVCHSSCFIGSGVSINPLRRAG